MAWFCSERAVFFIVAMWAPTIVRAYTSYTKGISYTENGVQLQHDHPVGVVCVVRVLPSWRSARAPPSSSRAILKKFTVLPFRILGTGDSAP